MFHRFHTNQLPQVIPSKTYDKDIFDKFINLINVKDEDHKLLLECYMSALLIADIPKAILILFGGQGAAKSTCQELIKTLLDPSATLTLAFPKTIAELVQQLSHNYIAYYDNVSAIRHWISDQLCRAVTGAGFSKRELYTDDDDIIYQFMRCIGINGINLAASKPDLLDRSIIIELIRIDDTQRRKIEIIKQEVVNMTPQLLGYIFDILVEVLKIVNAGGLDLKARSRMADFEEYCEIISRCMGNPSGKFLDVYAANRQLQTDAVIESTPVAIALITYMQKRTDAYHLWKPEEVELRPSIEFEGTMSNLLAELQRVASTELSINIRNHLWPKGANALSRKLNEIEHNLKEVGIGLSYTKDPYTRVKRVRVRIISLESLESLESQDHAQNQAKKSNDISSDISNLESNIIRINQNSTLKNGVPNDSKGPNDISEKLDLHPKAPQNSYKCQYCEILGHGKVEFTNEDLEKHGVTKTPRVANSFATGYREV